MKNPFRRRSATPVVMPIPAPPVTATTVLTQREHDAFTEAVAMLDREHPYAVVGKSLFYDVPIAAYSREQLIQILAWVGEHARDKTRDH